MNEKDCKIIRDIFPSYVDELTNKDTNQYIEEHLKNCEDCKKILENMKKELRIDTTKKDSKEVNYIKKFNKKMKLFKIILLGILLIFILSYARKMIIIVSLNNKISNYTSSTNYYMKAITYLGDDLTTIENYKKDNKYIRRLKVLSESSKIVTTDYYNGETINTYTELKFDEDNEEYVLRKTARLNNTDKGIVPVIPNQIEISNPINFVLLPLLSSVTSERCNDKDCYRIVINSTIYYIDKETGLTIREIGESSNTATDGVHYDMVTDIQYKFDIITEEYFIEPDIRKYEIEK